MSNFVVVINPGATSTKIALFKDGEELNQEKVEYTVDDLKDFSSSVDQIEFRWKDIIKTLEKWNFDELDASVGRGGLFQPLESGIYRVNKKMIEDIRKGKMVAEHISNIGAILAEKCSEKFGGKSYIVDPVSVDEFEDVARISGIPEIERKALQHTLNIKYVVRKACREINIREHEADFVVAHLGSGISICPIKNGRIIDANNAIEEGPYSPERAGGLPSYSLMKLCYSGKHDENWMKKRLKGNGGVVAYLNTNNMQEVERMIEKGNDRADLIYRGMIYQTAKEIGGMCAALGKKPEAIIITGGIAYQKKFTKLLKERISYMTDRILIYPGEGELEAMAEAGFRAISGEEEVKKYS